MKQRHDNHQSFFQNGYDSPAWNIKGSTVATNTASHTIMRAPGTTPVSIFEKYFFYILAYFMCNCYDDTLQQDQLGRIGFSA